MDLQEIVDDEIAPSRVATLFWVAVVVIGLAVGMVVVGHGTSSPPSSTAIVAPSSSVQAVPLPDVPAFIGLGHNLTLGYTCPTFTIDGTTLAVSFQVVNFGQTDVTLIAVKPALTKHGLRMVSQPTTGGVCAEPGNDPPGGLIAPGDSRLVTLRFARPAGCPSLSTSPHQLDVSVQEMIGATSSVTKSDLGLVYFNSC